jgi:hypothetical protein
VSAYRDAPRSPPVGRARFARLAILGVFAFVACAVLAPRMSFTPEILTHPTAAAWLAIVTLTVVAIGSIVVIDKWASTFWWAMGLAFMAVTLVVPSTHTGIGWWRRAIWAACTLALLTRPALSATRAWIPPRVRPLTRYVSASCGSFVGVCALSIESPGFVVALAILLAFVAATVIVEKRGADSRATAFDMSWPAVAALIDLFVLAMIVAFPLFVATPSSWPGANHAH